jgi:mono/diheme cytochrome c family protein
MQVNNDAGIYFFISRSKAMIRVNANVFRQVVLLWSLIGLPSAALADAGHDAKKEPPAMEGMDHGQMKKDGQGGAAATHWMAPEDAAKRKNPVAASAASIARGKKLFQANCASCHGAGGKGDGPAGAALSPKPADLTAMAGSHPDGDFAWKIEHGRGAMPAWKATLSEAQIWDTVNFIQSLAPRAAGQGEHAGASGHSHGYHHH